MIRGLVAGIKPTIVIVDSFASFLSFNGLDDNNRRDVELAWRLLDDWRTTGATLIVLDHVTKDKEARGRWAIGSERKIGATDQAYEVEADVKQPFGKGREGRATIKVSKDRDAHFARGTAAGTFVLFSDPDGHVIDWKMLHGDPEEIVVAFDGGERPTGIMEKVCAELAKSLDGMTLNGLNAAIGGAHKTKIKRAVDVLIAEGTIVVEPGPNRSHIHRLKPSKSSLEGGS